MVNLFQDETQTRRLANVKSLFYGGIELLKKLNKYVCRIITCKQMQSHIDNKKVQV